MKATFLDRLPQADDKQVAFVVLSDEKYSRKA
jgi:hypothetical protein